MPKSRSRSIDNKPKKSQKQNNSEEKEEEKQKKTKKKDIKSSKKINLKNEEKSPKKRATTNSKSKENKINKEQIENKITKRILRSKGKLINPTEITTTTRRKKNIRTNNKIKEEKEIKLEDNKISTETKNKKPKSLSKSKTKYNLKISRKSKKEFDCKKIILDKPEELLEKKFDEIIKKQKEGTKMDEEENDYIEEKVPKSKIKSIEKLKNNINSKTVKSNIDISKKLDFNDNNAHIQKKNEKKNSEDKKEKISNINLINNKNKKRKKSPKKIKDISSACDAEESLTFSEQNIIPKKDESYLYNSIDSQRISREVEEVIKRIERKKKEKKLNNLSNKKRKRTTVEKEKNITKVENRTSEEFNFILQKNPNIKNVPEYINIEEVSQSSIINCTDILLVILEICQNSNSYLFAYSTKSKMFWNDVLQYKVLKKIFNEFKAETLRKYWNVLSKYNPDNIYDLIKKNKDYLDATPSMKLGKIVSTISKIFSGKIPDFKESQTEMDDVPNRYLKKSKTVYKSSNNKLKKN